MGLASKLQKAAAEPCEGAAGQDVSAELARLRAENEALKHRVSQGSHFPSATQSQSYVQHTPRGQPSTFGAHMTNTVLLPGPRVNGQYCIPDHDHQLSRQSLHPKEPGLIRVNENAYPIGQDRQSFYPSQQCQHEGFPGSSFSKKASLISKIEKVIHSNRLGPFYPHHKLQQLLQKVQQTDFRYACQDTAPQDHLC